MKLCIILSLTYLNKDVYSMQNSKQGDSITGTVLMPQLDTVCSEHGDHLERNEDIQLACVLLSRLVQK